MPLQYVLPWALGGCGARCRPMCGVDSFDIVYLCLVWSLLAGAAAAFTLLVVILLWD